jgi:hypothetical protein
MVSAATVGITADKIIHTKVEVARVYFRIHFIKENREAGSADRITGSIVDDTEEGLVQATRDDPGSYDDDE